MVVHFKESSSKIYNMVRGFFNKKMAKDTKENSIKAISKDMENYFLRMVIYMKVSF
jgi:hypothetical protein